MSDVQCPLSQSSTRSPIPMSDWHNVSKREPCPICHKTDWCNLSNDGAVCICHRVESPHLARSGSGWIHRLIDRPPSYSSHKSYLSHVSKAASPGSVGRAVPSPPEQDSTIQCSPSPSTFTSTLDFEKVHRSYDSDPILIEGLATTLGVDDLALKSLDVRFNRFDECWSFPMRDADGQIIGLRFRELAGSRKWSARGSHDGLFMGRELVEMLKSSATANFVSRGLCCEQSSDQQTNRPTGHLSPTEPPSICAGQSSVSEAQKSTHRPCSAGRLFGCSDERSEEGHTETKVSCARKVSDLPRELVIVEGPSDTAAAMSLFHHSTPTPSTYTYLPVGRSSCQTGAAHLRALIRRVRPLIVTIVADNDVPGIKGAELLAQQLTHSSANEPFHASTIPLFHLPVRILVVPAPYKDLRAWYLSNTLTPRLFADIASAQRWR